MSAYRYCLSLKEAKAVCLGNGAAMVVGQGLSTSFLLQLIIKTVSHRHVQGSVGSDSP